MARRFGASASTSCGSEVSSRWSTDVEVGDPRRQCGRVAVVGDLLAFQGKVSARTFSRPSYSGRREWGRSWRLGRGRWIPDTTWDRRPRRARRCGGRGAHQPANEPRDPHGRLPAALRHRGPRPTTGASGCREGQGRSHALPHWTSIEGQAEWPVRREREARHAGCAARGNRSTIAGALELSRDTRTRFDAGLAEWAGDPYGVDHVADCLAGCGGVGFVGQK